MTNKTKDSNSSQVMWNYLENTAVPVSCGTLSTLIRSEPKLFDVTLSGNYCYNDLIRNKWRDFAVKMFSNKVLFDNWNDCWFSFIKTITPADKDHRLITFVNQNTNSLTEHIEYTAITVDIPNSVTSQNAIRKIIFSSECVVDTVVISKLRYSTGGIPQV